MITEKDAQLAPGLPPPYEAEAYVYRRPLFSRSLRRASSKRILFALCVSSLVSYAYFSAGRGSRLAAAATDYYGSVSVKEFEASLGLCAARTHFPPVVSPDLRTRNPRWNEVRGQKETIALRNVSLFDGESYLDAPVDIVFSRGLVTSVSVASAAPLILENGPEYNLKGRFVTPGLVDMHSHHLAMAWPGSEALDDVNEMNPLYGPLTPFLRVIESLKAYDPATIIIASGGITSSLIIPGSANVIGGEGTVVKNIPRSGASGEYVVEEMLLEHGVDSSDRRQYMKFACGENPKRIYGHTRMGNAYVLRHHLTRAKELMEEQNHWCDAASLLGTSAERAHFVENKGGFPEQLELESTIALLRGQVAMHKHCYEPEDLETILGVMREFGIQVKAFHHAIEAWQVPEMIKAYGGSQAAAGHAFHLPVAKALQAVTSIPAAALGVSYRVGYVRAGYDADIVVWDSDPLSIGATPQQVFIDGIATLDSKVVQLSTGASMETATAPEASLDAPIMRTRKTPKEVDDFCAVAKQQGRNFIIHGIRKSFLDNHPQHAGSISTTGNEVLTLVMNDGHVVCLSTRSGCEESITAASLDSVLLTLENGHLLPGLTAFTDSLGIKEIFTEEDTGNGVVKTADAKDPSTIVDYAKYGVFLDGKAFARARLGGVTRAITPPEPPAGLIQGVSTAIRTSGTKSILDGGILLGEVGLHVVIGQNSRETGSVSMAIKRLRGILDEHRNKGNESAFGLVAEGRLPLIISVESSIVALKRDYKDVYIVVNGGHGAPMVADELAAAGIPVIISATRPGPTNWDRRDVFVGPPLTRSPASILSEAGVDYAVSVAAEIPVGDSRIHDLALEASWAAKYAGLNEHEAVQLVSKKVEGILRLKASKDIVLWENNPLQWGASVVLSLEETEGGKLEVGTCWPDDDADRR
ncbi:RNA-splicing factor [Pestalotiopsis sp. IQ-011]